MRSALIYVHVPKCGGTTLTSLLSEAVPEGRRFFVDGRNVARSRAELAAMPAADRERIDLLAGHVSYGWHELLAPRPAWYFTIVRKPVSRVVSHYNFVRSHEAHYLHSAVVDGKMSVSDYVESGVTTEVNDGQVRQLSGVEDIVQAAYGGSGVEYGGDHGELLEEAWANIQRHFVLVGLLERFDESMRRLKRRTGLRIGSGRAKNVGSAHTTARTPRAEEVEVVRRYNRADGELYARCAAAFEQGTGRVERLKRLLIGRH
jgi:hypothetical protein